MAGREAVSFASAPVLFLHVCAILYFGLTTANVACGLLALPLGEAQGFLADILPVMAFLIAITLFSCFSLRGRLLRLPPTQEQMGVLLLIASSAISFVHFQFYHTTFSRVVYTILLGSVGIYALHFTWHRENANFPLICFLYGTFALVPAMHAACSSTTGLGNITRCFFLYSALNGIGGLIYRFAIPDQYLGLSERPFSEFIMHAFILCGTKLLLARLLALHTLGEDGSAVDCLLWPS